MPTLGAPPGRSFIPPSAPDHLSRCGTTDLQADLGPGSRAIGDLRHPVLEAPGTCSLRSEVTCYDMVVGQKTHTLIDQRPCTDSSRQGGQPTMAWWGTCGLGESNAST